MCVFFFNSTPSAGLETDTTDSRALGWGRQLTRTLVRIRELRAGAASFKKLRSKHMGTNKVSVVKEHRQPYCGRAIV